MTHDEALAWLGSLEALGIRPGLDRIRRLMTILDEPQNRFPSVLIAGTNGKGSVAAFTAALLEAAGQRPGVYTSPHLVRFEERIVVGDEPIGEDDLAELTGIVRDAIASDAALRADPPTYFEATTALAFLYFARLRVPIAVLEVGMGGRFDATNVVTPRVCAITPIGMDHTQWLGRTLSAIAHQKAGILKPGVPAVISAQDPATLEVVRAEASAQGVPLSFTRDCDVAPLAGPRAGRYPDPPAFTLTTPAGGRYPGLTLSLRGTHQVDNAVTAVLIAEHLGIDRTSIAAGLRTAVWPGRLELVDGSPAILLDGAHNPAGCATLAAYLEEHQARPGKVLVFAAMKDKDAREMLRPLAPLMRRVVVTGLSVPRGESPAALARLAGMVHGKVEESRSIEDALPRARAAAGGDGMVVVAGSLYLVGETKRVLDRTGS